MWNNTGLWAAELAMMQSAAIAQFPPSSSPSSFTREGGKLAASRTISPGGENYARIVDRNHHAPQAGVNSASRSSLDDKNECENAALCTEPRAWTSQAGQDLYVWQRVLQPQNLCCRGRFVEFGARDGIRHSNTAILEKWQQWTGLLAEVDVRLALLCVCVRVLPCEVRSTRVSSHKFD